jgi:hypothetical protein
MRKLNLWDWLSIIAAFVIVAALGFSVYAKAKEEKPKPITIIVKAGNLEPEVADAINVGDSVLDRDGRPYFKITQIKENRQAKQAVVTWDSKLISAENPEQKSVIFEAVSVNPKFKGASLYYNWELVKPGKKIYMETTKTGFFGIIVSIEDQSKTEPAKGE